MATTESLKQQVQTTQQNQVANQPKPQTIEDYMKKMAPAMAQA